MEEECLHLRNSTSDSEVWLASRSEIWAGLVGPEAVVSSKERLAGVV